MPNFSGEELSQAIGFCEIFIVFSFPSLGGELSNIAWNFDGFVILS
jgi:hypothetical protein